MSTCPQCNRSYENDAPLCPRCTVAQRAETDRRKKRLSTLDTVCWLLLCLPGVLSLIHRNDTQPPAHPVAVIVFRLTLMATGLAGLISLAIYRRKNKIKDE